MPNDINNPGNYDAVLGGNNPPPINAVVLGRIEGIKQLEYRLLSQVVENRVSALSEALNYGEEGLSLVIQALNDLEEVVYQSAYDLLKDRKETKVQVALSEYIKHCCIRFDGFYCNYKEPGDYEFVRFYEDGTILSITLYRKPDIEHVATWFNKHHGYIGKGIYKIERNTIGFFKYSNKPYCSGEIGKYGNTISLVWNYAPFQGALKYYFIHIANLR
ncbi:GUN4 domain protein [Calothrix sp. NIES-4071]|nr:GUN4 domain protein [Calothrix sp. NIES-4071]BAZ56817.1 GUN4 domain protein [Calothrix sp. NIES-4105]